MTRFFCPGRTELAGNHSDMQKGRVMTAAIDQGITAEAEPNGEGVVRIVSDGFPTVEVDLSHLWPDEHEAGTANALTRGMAAALAENGCRPSGFDAHYFSDLPPGQGLSSSAAFSVLTGYIMSAFSPDEPMAPEDLARAAQKTESRWFGKPCSLATTMACALGGGVYMDVLENRLLSIACDFDALGLALCLVDPGDSSAGWGAATAQIGADMTAVAQTFGEPFLARVRGPAFEEVWLPHQRELPWLHASHFFGESFRAAAMADALGLRDGQRYMELMAESGHSAQRLLQVLGEGGLSDALSRGARVSDDLLAGRGAWRIHGVGFGGCLQALMPVGFYGQYRAAMEELYGPGCCRRIHTSARGVCEAQDDKALFLDRESPEL